MAKTVRTLVTKDDFTTSKTTVNRFGEFIDISPISNLDIFPVVAEYKSISSNSDFIFFENTNTVGDGLSGIYAKSIDTNPDDIGVYITIGSQKYRRLYSGVVLLDWFSDNVATALLRASNYYAVECIPNKVYEIQDTITLNVTLGLTLDMQGATFKFIEPVDYCFNINVLKNIVCNITNGNIEVTDEATLVNVAKLTKINTYVDILTNMQYNTTKLPDLNKLVNLNEPFEFKAHKHIETLTYTGVDTPIDDNSVVPLTYIPQIDDSDCIKLKEPLGSITLDETLGKVEGTGNQGMLVSQLDLLVNNYAKDYLDNYYRNNKIFTTTTPGGYYTVPKGVIPTLQGVWTKYEYDGIPDTIDVYAEAIASIEFSTVTEILMDEGELDKPIYIKCTFKSPVAGTFSITEVECEEAKEMCEGLSPLEADSYTLYRIDNFIADLAEVSDSYGGLAGAGLTVKLPAKPEFYVADTIAPGITSISTIKTFYIKAFVIEGTYGYGASLAGFDTLQSDFKDKYNALIEEEFNKAQAGSSSWINNIMAAVGWEYFYTHYGQQIVDEFKTKMTNRLNEVYVQGGLTSKLKVALRYKGKLSYSNEINLYIARLMPKEGLDSNKEHKYYSKYTLSTSTTREAVYGYPSQYFYYNNTPITMRVSQAKIDKINEKYMDIDWLMANGFVGSRLHGPFGAPYMCIRPSGCCSGSFKCGANGVVGSKFYLVTADSKAKNLWYGICEGLGKKCVYGIPSVLMRYYYPQIFEDDAKPCGYYDSHWKTAKAFINRGPTTVEPGNYAVCKFLLRVSMDYCYLTNASAASLATSAKYKGYNASNGYTSEADKNLGNVIEDPYNTNFYARNYATRVQALDTYPSKSTKGQVEPKWKGSIKYTQWYPYDCHTDCYQYTPYSNSIPKDYKVDPKTFTGMYGGRNNGFYAAGDLLGIQLSIVNGIGKNRLFDKVFGKGNWDFNDDYDGAKRFLQSDWNDDTTRVAWRKPGAHIKCCDSMPRGLNYNNYTYDFTSSQYKHYSLLTTDNEYSKLFIRTEE